MVAKENNRMFKESDKLRKQFKDSDISTDEFLNQFIKSRTKYHESEIIKSKLTNMAET